MIIKPHLYSEESGFQILNSGFHAPTEMVQVFPPFPILSLFPIFSSRPTPLFLVHATITGLEDNPHSLHTLRLLPLLFYIHQSLTTFNTYLSHSRQSYINHYS